MTNILRTAAIPGPEVSFVMAARNAERFVEEAVRSILAQPGPPFELIIVDDASDDHTLQVLLQFFDPRITLLHLDEKVFVSRARNHAFPFVRAPWICIFDADDIMLPNVFAPYFHTVTAQPGAQWGYCAMRHVHENGQPNGSETRNRFDFLKMLHTNILPHPMSLLRTDLYLKTGGYDETLPYSIDYDLWLKVMEWTDPVFYNHYGVDYRRHTHALGTTTNQGHRAVHDLMKRRIGLPHSDPVVRQRRSWMCTGLQLLDAASSCHWTLVPQSAEWLHREGLNSFLLDYYYAQALDETGRPRDGITLCFCWIRFLQQGGFLNSAEAQNLAVLSLNLALHLNDPEITAGVLPFARFVQKLLPQPELAELIERTALLG